MPRPGRELQRRRPKASVAFRNLGTSESLFLLPNEHKLYTYEELPEKTVKFPI
jgi:hypothetical protein